MKKLLYTPGRFLLASFDDADFASGRVVQVEGNWYLDKSLADFSHLRMVGEGKNYFCPIKKGWCDYYTFDNGVEMVEEIAWVYSQVANSLFDTIVGKIAFWKGKFVEEDA